MIFFIMVVREILPVTTSSGATSAMLTASTNNGQYINPDDILNPLASNDVSTVKPRLLRTYR